MPSRELRLGPVVSSKCKENLVDQLGMTDRFIARKMNEENETNGWRNAHLRLFHKKDVFKTNKTLKQC